MDAPMSDPNEPNLRIGTPGEQSLRGLEREGFRRVFILRSPEEIASVEIVREPAWTDRRGERGPFDVIGDVHGCLDELVELLNSKGIKYAREHFRFPGYTFHFDPRALSDRAALRAKLGYGADERVILASVGGTRVGHSLLRKCAEAFSLVASQIPETRLILVGGPRLAELGPAWGPRVEVRSFVPDLFEHQAAVDLAIVQGGLTTTMELAALRTPFLYFPLRNHFEQQLHVARRLDRLGAGVRLDYERTSPEALGAAMLEYLGKPVHSAMVPLDGTDRAAQLIADLL